MDRYLTENQWSAPIELSQEQVAQLEALGRRFLATNGWTSQPNESTAINLRHSSGNSWSVRVDNAVGVLAAGDLRLIVESKIPLTHLVHLLVRAGRLPASALESSRASSEKYFWELVAGWYVAEVERLIRAGLRRGYTERDDDLSVLRGRLLPLRTVQTIARGSGRMTCRYEEFSEDTPLNRVLCRAAELVGSSSLLPSELRRRALRAASRIGAVGPLQPTDLLVKPDRSEKRYSPAMELAVQVIDARGRSLAAGDHGGRAFLIRTPEPIELAFRSICQDELADLVRVAKGFIQLDGAAKSLNPDLTFGDIAVGDVKYKVWTGSWPRNDLYQLVTFATGFGVRHATRLGFSSASDVATDEVAVGPVSLYRCDWETDGDIAPSASEHRFRTRVRNWFELIAGDRTVAGDPQSALVS